MNFTLPRLTIVTPVFNDWASFRKLLEDVDAVLAGRCRDLTVVAVNDGSTLQGPVSIGVDFKTIDQIKVLDVAVNLGHQRAIAVGLAHSSRGETDCIIVMDSDGEDKPSDIGQILAQYAANPDCIHVVERGRRYESITFRIYYKFYKALFYAATGTRLAHGNFCLLPLRSVVGILHSPHTWNNLAASIMRSKMPYLAHRMDRGKRYEGKSKMGFTSLLLHGLSAISVYLDIVTVRLLIASGIILGVLVAMVLVVVGVRIFSDLAIPGWATVTTGMLVIIITQVVMLALNFLLNLLHNRSQNLTVPAEIDKLYVMAVRTLFERNARS